VRIAYASRWTLLRIPRLDPSLFADAGIFRGIDRLNDILFGYQDFAAIGVKRLAERV
jgi:hypothetical protein